MGLEFEVNQAFDEAKADGRLEAFKRKAFPERYSSGSQPVNASAGSHATSTMKVGDTHYGRVEKGSAPAGLVTSGYSAAGISKTDYAGAIQRYNTNQEVYLLYDDGTESLAESLDDLFAHANRGGEFGFEASSPEGV